MAKLIEPRLALAVARTITGDAATGSTYLAQRLVRDLEIAVPRSHELVAAHGGVAAPAPVRWSVVDRATWVEANIRGMNTMIAPLAERIGKRMDTMPLPSRWAQTAVVSAEVGALLGFVSRR